MLLLSVLPLVNLFLTSFYNVTWSGGQPTWTPVGVANYVELSGDELLRAGFLNTLMFAGFAVGGQMLFGFLLALMCCRVTRGPGDLPDGFHSADPRSRHRGRRDLEAAAQF
jgi:multiple sugar transport system permease protein